MLLLVRSLVIQHYINQETSMVNSMDWYPSVANDLIIYFVDVNKNSYKTYSQKLYGLRVLGTWGINI